MVDVSLTAHLAKLSKLSFSEEELEHITEQMQDIIALMDKIADYEPSTLLGSDDGKGFSTLRKDQPLPSFHREDILGNSDDTKDGCFTVSKVVE
jgi:aspartyl-tRNA(Asn)/glutamyl-tRNA(Gln) amidotransferase subunit C